MQLHEKSRSRGQITITAAQLRAEGVIEVGCAPQTSVLFVMTSAKLHLFHANRIPDRTLDDYAIRLAVTWIEYGFTSYEVAQNLGVDDRHLQEALLEAGYQRKSLWDGGPREGFKKRYAKQGKAAKKRRGNRRGRLVRLGDRFHFMRTPS
jgi:hypothetical protein